jgi:hypothetical protein
MGESELLSAFRSATLEDFTHRTHLHVAWLFLRRDGRELGTQNLIEGLHHFTAAKGASAKFHLTMTLFWSHMLDAAMRSSPGQEDFEAFLASNAHLTVSGLVHEYYSRESLATDAARTGWVGPDLRPLP